MSQKDPELGPPTIRGRGFEPQDQDEDRQLEQEPLDKKKTDNGPFLRKLCLVCFVFMVLVGAVTIDQRVRNWWLKSKEPKEENLKKGELAFAKQPQVKLTSDEEYRLHLAKMQAEEESGFEEEPPLPSEQEGGQAQLLGESKEGRIAPIFRFFGSESGQFTRVVARRLYEVANFAFAIALAFIAFRILTNPDATTGAVTTLDTPLTGLTSIEKTTFLTLVLLALYQCCNAFFSPSWLSFLPSPLMQAHGRLRSVIGRVQNNFPHVIEALNPLNWMPKSLALSLSRSWSKSYTRWVFRSICPEGTFESAKKFLWKNYSHLICAPFWITLLLGFHMLHLYDAEALVKIVQTAIPWAIPDTFIKRLEEPMATALGTMAAGQPIYATIATWLVVSFGVGSVIRSWSYRKRSGEAVSEFEYYKPNNWGKRIHLIVGFVCLGLLVLYYVPAVQWVAKYLTGLPLETAINAGYVTARAALWVGLQTAVRSAALVLQVMRDLQWPSTEGILPFVFTMSWNAITLFALYAIPKIIGRILERREVWRRFGAKQKEAEEKMQNVIKVALSTYVVIVVLIGLPMFANVALKPICYYFSLPLPRNMFAISQIYNYFYTTVPLLLIPPYLCLFALQYKWVHRLRRWIPFSKRLPKKLAPALIVLGLFIFSCFYYAMINYVFYPENMKGLFIFLDWLVPLLSRIIVSIVQSLSANFDWVGPMAWTLFISGVFSLLLYFVPTFLDSTLGGLLYLPAYHFVGQVLMILSIGIPNVPTLALIAVIGFVQVATSLALMFRGIGRFKQPVVKYLVPWVDEFRDLVSGY